MSEQVKNVSEVAREIAGVSSLASDVASKLRENINNVKEALGQADAVSGALKSAGDELRGVLGILSNNPPPGSR